MSAIEKRYANALMEALKNKEEREKVQAELSELVYLFNSNSQLKKALLDPRVSSNIKLGVINELFSCANHIFISFISLLIDKNRIGYLDGILKEYKELTRLMNNELFIKIVSATALDDDEINGISDKYRRVYKASAVKHELIIDESLIGGVKVIVGNRIYDGSLKTQLRNML